MKRTSYRTSFIEIYNRIISEAKMLTEGDHWPEDYVRKAVSRIMNGNNAISSSMNKITINGNVYSEQQAKEDVNEILNKFEHLSHNNKNLGYFLPIIRWFIQYSGNSNSKREDFLKHKLDKIIDGFNFVVSNKDENEFKNDLKQKWTLDDFENKVKELKSNSKPIEIKGTNAKYTLIPIKTYEELNIKYGGDKTGYKGNSEWCHTNGKSTYESWTQNYTKFFFVLARNGWEDIKPYRPKNMSEYKLEKTNAYDEYGTSLIAILVDENGKLLACTLRWNHIVNPCFTIDGRTVDRAYISYDELNKVTGLNVENEVKMQLKKFRNLCLQK